MKLLGFFNKHDDLLKKVEKVADQNIAEREQARVERSKKKIGEEGYLLNAVDIIDDDSLCGYKKMLTDGTIVAIDDYVSATTNPQLGVGSSLGGIHEQRKLVQQKGVKGDIMNFGDGGYSHAGYMNPQDVHRETRQIVAGDMRAAGVPVRLSPLD